MDARQCSHSKPCEPSASSPAGGGVWAKLGLGCDRAFRGAYWCSQGVNSSQYNLVCNQETFRMVSQRHISRLPDTVRGGNPYEKEITERCVQQSGKTLQAVISEWISKFDNKELDRSRLQLNHVDAITSRTYLCNFFHLMMLTGRVAGMGSCAVPSTIDLTMLRS